VSAIPAQGTQPSAETAHHSAKNNQQTFTGAIMAARNWTQEQRAKQALKIADDLARSVPILFA
jgi:hypothetical protein